MEDGGEGKGKVVVVGKKKERVADGERGWKPKGRKVEETDAAQTNDGLFEGVLVYTSTSENRLWAKGGMVAKVVSGDSALSIQPRLEDAGFNNVVVTPMGSDRFFLYCTGDADIWNNVFKFSYASDVLIYGSNLKKNIWSCKLEHILAYSIVFSIVCYHQNFKDIVQKSFCFNTVDYAERKLDQIDAS